MCTLIVGRSVTGPDTTLVAANRDESPARASLPPGILGERPRMVGGRDQVAGGTWLAVREGPALVALLNRYHPGMPEPPAGRRSRGLLALDVARSSAPDPLKEAMALARAADYAPFTLFYASPSECWIVALDSPGEPRAREVGEGWHVLTHRELDDPREPRATWLAARLRDERPGSATAAEELAMTLLREHGNATPAVCLHQGRMVTVSSTIVTLQPRGARYLHAEGRPCEHPYEDRTSLLASP